jgi:hypothetical protein
METGKELFQKYTVGLTITVRPTKMENTLLRVKISFLSTYHYKRMKKS